MSRASGTIPLERAAGSGPVGGVIAAGCGVSAGTVFCVLAAKGLKVFCLEAGSPIVPAKNFLHAQIGRQRPSRS